MSTQPTPRILCDQPGCGKTFKNYNSLHVHRSIYHRHRNGRVASTRPVVLALTIPKFEVTKISDLLKRASGVYSALVDWNPVMEQMVSSIVEQVKKVVRYFQVSEGEFGICIGKSYVTARGEHFDASDTDTWSAGGIQSRSYAYGNFILCALVCIDESRVPEIMRNHGVDRHVWACAWERAVKIACERDPVLAKLMDSAKTDAGGGKIACSSSIPVIYVAIPRGQINGVSPVVDVEVAEVTGLTLDTTSKPPSARRGDGVLDVLCRDQ